MALFALAEAGDAGPGDVRRGGVLALDGGLDQAIGAVGGEEDLVGVVEAERGKIDEIKFSMPNKHHFLVDLSPFGLDNPNEVFFAADRPYGLIEATVQREDATPAAIAWSGIAGFC